METTTKYPRITVNINDLHPHPNNPRIDLGDLTELSTSIAAKGILQRPVVIPRIDPVLGQDEGYTILIGHRRIAAAKMAGLTSIVVEFRDGLSLKEQIGVMQAENMQREDLTLKEEVDSYQYRIDMGESAEDIARSDGISKRTVQRRLKLAALPKDAFAHAQEVAELTLEDYAAIAELPADQQESLLNQAGSNNFQYNFRTAVETENRRKKRQALILQLSSFAVERDIPTEESERTKIKCLKYWYGYTMEDASEFASTPGLLYQVEHNKRDEGIPNVTLWRYLTAEECAAKATEKASKEAAEAAKADRDCSLGKEIDALNAAAANLRMDFLKAVPAATIKDHLGEILLLREKIAYGKFGVSANADILDSLTGGKKKNWMCRDDVAKAIANDPARSCLLLTAASVGTGNMLQLDWRKNPESCVSEALSDFYKLLEVLGYQISDSEASLLDGSHEVLRRQKKCYNGYYGYRYTGTYPGTADGVNNPVLTEKDGSDSNSGVAYYLHELPDEVIDQFHLAIRG